MRGDTAEEEKSMIVLMVVKVNINLDIIVYEEDLITI